MSPPDRGGAAPAMAERRPQLNPEWVDSWVWGGCQDHPDPNGIPQYLEDGDSAAGERLPTDLRSQLESKLGSDLSNVTVHNDNRAHSQASAHGALAFAVGDDIYFGAGNYQPQTSAGRQLIAHEVAHTIQQRGSEPVTQTKLSVSTAGDTFEDQADRFAEAFVSGEPTPTVSPGAPRHIARAAGDRLPVCEDLEDRMNLDTGKRSISQKPISVREGLSTITVLQQNILGLRMAGLSRLEAQLDANEPPKTRPDNKVWQTFVEFGITAACSVLGGVAGGVAAGFVSNKFFGTMAKDATKAVVKKALAQGLGALGPSEKWTPGEFAAQQREILNVAAGFLQGEAVAGWDELACDPSAPQQIAEAITMLEKERELAEHEQYLLSLKSWCSLLATTQTETTEGLLTLKLDRSLAVQERHWPGVGEIDLESMALRNETLASIAHGNMRLELTVSNGAFWTDDKLIVIEVRDGALDVVTELSTEVCHELLSIAGMPAHRHELAMGAVYTIWGRVLNKPVSELSK